MYCWFVVDSVNTDIENIKGLPVRKGMDTYILAYKTLPEGIEYDFVPGLGISRFQFAHGGTVSESNVRLIEYVISNAPESTINQTPKVEMSSDWEVYYEDKAPEDYNYTVKTGSMSDKIGNLRFSYISEPGGNVEISHIVNKLVKDFIQGLTKDESKLISADNQLYDFGGKVYSGKYTTISFLGGNICTIFVVGDSDGIWHGSFTGTNERWEQAFEIFKAFLAIVY